MYDNLKNWKWLQDNSYFEDHKLKDTYSFKETTFPEWLEEVRDRVIVEIGSGYGRETAAISKVCKHIYAIEVSDTILDTLVDFVDTHGNLANTTPVLYEHYKEVVPSNVDKVYARFLFQHLTPQEALDYIQTLSEKLVGGGCMYFQFLLYNESDESEFYQRLKPKEEPLISYSLGYILNELLRGFENSWMTHEVENSEGVPFKHLYVKSTKK